MPTKWRTYAPLACYYDTELLRDGAPVELGQGVVVELAPTLFQREEVLEKIGWVPRENLQGHTSYTLYVDGELRDRHDRAAPRPVPGGTRLSTAVQAIWLVKPSNLSYELLLSFDTDNEEPRFWQCHSFDQRSVLAEYFNAVVRPADLEAARTVHEAILQLDRDGVLWLTLSLINVARSRQPQEIHYLVIWTAIEGLFGAEKSDRRDRPRLGVTERLARRLSGFSREFLGESVEPAEMKRLYDLRSRIAHGARNVDREALPGARYRSEDLIRRAFLRVLDDPELCRVFDSNDRDPFLRRFE